MRAAIPALIGATLTLGVGCGDDDVSGGIDAGGGPDAARPDAPVSGLDERPSNLTCAVPPRPRPPGVPVTAVRAHPRLPRLDRPLMARPGPVGRDEWYVIEQPGRLVRFADAPEVEAFDVALDLRDRVDASANEEGLLGFAFHPDFARTGRLFVSYTGFDGGAPRSFVTELRSQDEGLTFDPGSERVVLAIDKPLDNHNGGHIEFGPDGYLYVATGDGGGGGDPFENGRDPDTLLGAILRIDVDGAEPYAIPPDNPFADGAGGRPEIFAYGLRNPWRFSFDRETGELWAGDVGQNRFEEIDLIERGGNYGWNEREGFECFRAGCASAGLVDPVFAYGRDEGRSVTGGYVYRGREIPGLSGAYVYADFASGQVWALRPDAETGGWRNAQLFTSSSVSSFAEDEAGELYLLDLIAGVMRRVRATGSGPDPDPFPPRLSETGCFDADDPRGAAPGLVPYRTAATLWSDGAEKERWIALPDGAAARFREDGDLELPIGTVIAKAFRTEGRLVETRLFVRHDDGGWAGYSYAWREDQSDADLVDTATVVDFVAPGWRIPTRAQCLQCHTAAAGFSLGLEAAQLRSELTYPSTGRRAEQLATWLAVGLAEGPPPDGPALAGYADDAASIADRARAYLHVNCANCHRPEGPGRGDLDLRFTTPLAETGACRPPENGDLGLEDARVVAPGSPERSLLLERMRRRDVWAMPPLASEQVDPTGVALVEAWIEGLRGCEE